MIPSGEQELGKWSLKYFNPNGRKYFGTLIITNQRLSFFYQSQKTAMEWLTISKNDISSVCVIENFLQKKVVISVKGKKHTFTNFFFNTKKFINLLKK